MIGPDGKIPSVNADGIEVSPDRKLLYFCSPFGGPLWQVAIDDLLNEKLDASALESRVKNLGDLIPVGGILTLPSGELLLSAGEDHALEVRHADRKKTIVARSPLLDWPDAMSIGADGYVYVAAAQANRAPNNNGGKDETRLPFRILKVRLADVLRAGSGQ